MNIKFIVPQLTQIKSSRDNTKNSFKTNKSHISFGSIVEPLDKFYKVALKKGLKEQFNLNCELEDLNSIAGPCEFKKLINKFMPRDFETGHKTNATFFGPSANKYAVDGTFRVNLHLHSNVSDGKLSPKQILEMCTTYANKVAKNLEHNDNIPPFTASLTDHDKFSGCIEIIKEIAQAPNKYENFKFVVGSGFLMDGYEKPYSVFEAVGLGFNPFDKNLNEKVTKTNMPNQLNFLQDVKKARGVCALAHPIRFMERVNDHFFEFLKKHGVEGVEGNYQYSGFDYDEYMLENIETVNNLAKKHGMILTGGTDSHARHIFADGVFAKQLDEILNH